MMTCGTSAAVECRVGEGCDAVGDGVERGVDVGVQQPQGRETAVAAAGFPDSVPAWYTGPAGASMSNRAADPATACQRQTSADHLPSLKRSGTSPRSLLEPPPTHAARRGKSREDLVP